VEAPVSSMPDKRNPESMAMTTRTATTIAQWVLIRFEASFILRLGQAFITKKQKEI
jgi:hypothetical protein